MTHNLDAIFIRPLETCIGLGCQSAMCSCYYVRNSSRNARKMSQKIATQKSATLKVRRFETEKGYRVNLFCCLYSAILLFGT